MIFVGIDEGRIELYPARDILPMKFDPDPEGAADFLNAIMEICGNDEVSFMSSSSVDFPGEYGIPGFDIDAWMEMGWQELNIRGWANDVCVLSG